MEHWKQHFNYQYTGAYELNPGEEKTVKIKTVKKESVTGADGKLTQCLVAYFHGEIKPMILNKTNCKSIEKLYSPFVENWKDKEITIYASKVKAFGDVVDALRIRPTVPKKTDISLFEKQLRDCKTLDELKTVFSSKGFPQSELNNLKNELKTKLT
jgi:hypothetical protein